MAGGLHTGSGHFWVRRIHSLCGILLSALFVFCFLIPFSAAFGGEASFNRLGAIIARMPFADGIEILFFILPLIFHSAVGLSLIYSSQFNVISQGAYANWMYALRRFSGLLLVPFFAFHLVSVRLPFLFSGHYPDYAYLQRFFLIPWHKALYCAGLAIAGLHIGNGLASALVRWGITSSRRSQEGGSIAGWAIALVIAAWGVKIVMSF